jgi:hypothetical protein
MTLKAVLIGPRGTIYKDGKAQTNLLEDLIVFIRRMFDLGVHVGLWSRHSITYTHQGQSESVENFLSRRTGITVPFYRAGAGNLPIRRRGGSAMPIFQHLGVQPHEAILVGNDDEDMYAGVNNRLLLVRPEWYLGEHEYGFKVSSISELARFCELFGLRQHPIFWGVDDGNLHVRSMGPFSTTANPDFAMFSADARAVAKYDAGERQFWFLMILSSLYFSGLMHQVDFMTPFPGHNPNSISEVRKGLDALLTTLGKCFRKDYLPDLIVRHQAAIKSQTATLDQKTFRNQLNTLHLNRRARRYDREPPKSDVRLSGKQVLVVDDFCTNGRSLDVARAYIEAAGGTAVLFSWLKTVNRGFLHMTPPPHLHPFQPNQVATEPTAYEYRYQPNIENPDAPAEISRIFTAYRTWAWP